MVEEYNNNVGSFTEITICDEFNPDDTTIIQNNINFEYCQDKPVIGISREFVIFDHVYIRQTIRKYNPKAFRLNFFRYKEREEERFCLVYMDPVPVSNIHRAWGWFISAVTALVLSSLLFYLTKFTNFIFAQQYLLPVVILLLCFSLIAFMVAYSRSYNKITYKSFAGQVPLLELYHMPRNTIYNEFTEFLGNSINNSHHRKNMKQRLVGEVRELRRLLKAGYLNNEQYETSRDLIFRHSEYDA